MKDRTAYQSFRQVLKYIEFIQKAAGIPGSLIYFCLQWIIIMPCIILCTISVYIYIYVYILQIKQTVFGFDNNGSNGFDELPQNDSQHPFNIVHRNVQRTILENENCSVEQWREWNEFNHGTLTATAISMYCPILASCVSIPRMR